MKKTIETKKISDIDKLYQERFVNDVTSQSQNIVDIAKWLISIEVILFNIYLSALAYLSKESIVTDYSFLTIIALLMGMFSIISLMLIIFPIKIKVNENIFIIKSGKKNIGVKDYFHYTAKRKYIYLSVSLFFLGISFISILTFIFLNWRT